MRMRRRGGGIGAFLVLLVLAGLWVRFELYGFLARHAPVGSPILVVEGWMSDDVLRQAAEWAETNGVVRIIATGGPIATGSWLTEWTSYAEMTRARLEAMGLADRFELSAVPARKVRRGRTRESARALNEALGREPGAFNLASEGPHTRRSWRAFQEVFGDGVEVGSVALTPAEYDGADWWTCSEGVRSMLSETVACMYDSF
jgi:hypothetical protein